MTRLLKEQAAFLHFFPKATKVQQKFLLQHITKEQLQALTEVIYNLLKGSITLTKDEKKTLKRWATELRAIGNPKTGLKRKRLHLKAVVISKTLTIALPFVERVICSEQG